MSDPAGRVDNGLHARTYVPLTDVDPALGQQALTALGRARIAAYLTQSAGTDRSRLFVATDERGDARTIVAALARTLGDGPAPGASGSGRAGGERPGDSLDGDPRAGDPFKGDPLDGVDTDAAFDALVADWRVDTVAAVRDAERDLTREDADWRARLARAQSADEVWLDEDHYVPPAPPPLPRLAGPTVLGVAVLALSIVVLALGGRMGLADDLTLVLGISGLVLSAVIFFTRVREHHRDEDDDGSAV